MNKEKERCLSGYNECRRISKTLSKKHPLCTECKQASYKLYTTRRIEDIDVRGYCSIDLIVPHKEGRRLRCHHVFYGNIVGTDYENYAFTFTHPKSWKEIWDVLGFTALYEEYCAASSLKKYQRESKERLEELFKTYSNTFTKSLMSYYGHCYHAVVVEKSSKKMYEIIAS